MRNPITLLDIDLHLFDGAAGGAAAGGEAGGEAVQGEAGALPKAETKRPGSSRRGRSGEFDNVVFGKQEDASAAIDTPVAGENAQGKGNKSGVEVTSDTLEAKEQAFRDLIKGEYKDQFTKEIQSVIDRRFKEVKGMETSLNAQKPILDMLMQRYNIADGDVAKLQDALEKDDVYWEDAADKAGLTVEQFKAMQKLERENAELREIRQRQLGEQQAQQQLNKWYTESEEVKKIYPSFDFRAEMANREFAGLLKSGIPVQKAYELVHMQEIMDAKSRTAAQAAGEQLVAKLKSKASRPLENGTSAQSAVIVKSDVGNLTRAERAEIARRAARGETIKF